MLEGEIKIETQGKQHALETGGYVWLPPNIPYHLLNKSESLTRMLWLRRRYHVVEGIAIPAPIISMAPYCPQYFLASGWETGRYPL